MASCYSSSLSSCALAERTGFLRPGHKAYPGLPDPVARFVMAKTKHSAAAAGKQAAKSAAKTLPKKPVLVKQEQANAQGEAQKRKAVKQA